MTNFLPPMSSFRDPSSHRAPMAHSFASSLYSQTTSPPSPLSSSDPLVNRGAQPTQTDDTIGNALASIYSAEPPGNSFSSTPATPVSSPSPLSGVTHWSRSGTHATPTPNSGYSGGTLLPLIQRAELEYMGQREANTTALLAIGPRKKAKMDSNLSASNPVFDPFAVQIKQELIDDYTEHEETDKEFQKEFGRIKKENLSLKKQILDYKINKKDLEDQILKFNGIEEKLKLQEHSFQEEISKLQESTREIDIIRKNEEIEHDNLQKEYGGMKNENLSLMKEVCRLKDSEKSLRQEIKQLVNRRNEMEKKIENKYQEEFRRMKKENLSLKKQVCRLKDSEKSLRQEIKQLVNRRNEMEKKHMSEDVEDPGTSEIVASNLIHQENYDPSNLDKNTCFFCSIKFPSFHNYMKHLHHVHMKWTTREAVDYSEIEYSGENEGEIGQAIQEIQTNSVLEISLNQNDPSSIMSNLERFDINVKSQMNGQQIFACGTTETPKDEQVVTVSIKETLLDQQSNVSEFITSDLTDHKAAKVFEAMDFLDVTTKKVESSNKSSVNQSSLIEKEESDVSNECKHLGDFHISLDDLPDDNELAEIGFPNKVGHFCHLCDTVIESYRLYYLHMHNLHQLEKRFQCIITACGRTFTQTLAFQKHALNHNQKSEHYCSMCDNVFFDEEELQDHLISSDHASKYMQVQEKYRGTEPHNHCCKVCDSWFGLFSTFVKHMETESHSYHCQECGLLFVQPIPRRSHIQNIHPEIANICEICGVKFSNFRAIWNHLSIHNIVYECPKCHRRFLQKEQLVAHSEVHAPPTPCPWEGCKRKLATKVGLFNHLRIHRGDTDFKCTICNKGFFKKKTLESHMRIHDGRAPLQMPSAKGSKNVAHLMGRTAHVDINQQVEEIQIEQAKESIDSNPTEMIQLVCAGCMHPFESENHFESHICAGKATGMA